MTGAVFRVSLVALVSAAAPLAAGGEIAGALIVLEASPGPTGRDPSSAPPRFVLLKDGDVFVGGTWRVEAGRLEKGEAQALRKRAGQVRKLPGLASPVALGGDTSSSLHLRLLEDDPLDLVVSGDLAAAPPPLAPLAALLSDLLSFHHPSLRPYAPPAYLMTAREARLPGGCRAWGFAFPIAEVLASPRILPAAEATGWPTGAVPASVCADEAGGGRRYTVTLRPLLPGEQR